VSDRATVVPEPEVKASLAALGVRVPAGTVATGTPDASRLRGPLVLKAYGPGIVHKTELGAVRLGLTHTELDGAVEQMRARLAARGIAADGFLVEEQCDRSEGVELLVGVVRREPAGLVVALGVGGTLVETLDLVALRMFPLREQDAWELVAAFPGAALLDGARGRPAADRGALVHVLLALAGADGLAAAAGDALVEIECNPVLVTPTAAIALDARLMLRAVGTVPPQPLKKPTDFTALFAPRAVAVAGASTARVGFGNRALAAYRAAGWTDHLYALHPDAATVDGVPAYRSAADIDDDVDYVLVAVPAARCAEVVRGLPPGRVPFVQVISGGFGEVGPEGVALGAALVDAADATRTRLVGPNCIGVFSPAGRQTFQLGAPTTVGRVSVVSQSGGLSGDIVRAGARRGVAFSKVLSAGNCVDVTAAEVLDWLVDDPESAVIGCYLEQATAELVEVLRRARGTKPVVLLVGGQSDQGAAAAASHTGALVDTRRVWEAIARSTGVGTARTLEEFVGALAYLDRWPIDPWSGATGHSGGVLVLGPGGGASVLATDACDRAGLVLTPTNAAARRVLRELGLSAGTSVVNPLEIPFGPAVPVDALRTVLEPVLAEQRYADVLVHVNVAAYYGYGTEGARPLVAQLRDLADAAPSAVPLAVVLRNLAVAPGDDADELLAGAHPAGLVTFPTLDDAAVAIAARATAARA
jgi:acyl-CoA synthetase (NDP forming)